MRPPPSARSPTIDSRTDGSDSCATRRDSELASSDRNVSEPCSGLIDAWSPSNTPMPRAAT